LKRRLGTAAKGSTSASTTSKLRSGTTSSCSQPILACPG
jgi:hypothetical protein